VRSDAFRKGSPGPGAQLTSRVATVGIRERPRAFWFREKQNRAARSARYSEAMSLENEQFARRLLGMARPLERGDFEAWVESDAVAADAEWIPAAELDSVGTYRGSEGFREFLGTWTEDFERWSVQLERVLYAGDNRIVALLHQSAIGRGSGIPVENEFALVLDLADGRVIRGRAYLDPAEALEAARGSA
jgi:ketosteroid isomerase-like protein